MFKEISKEILSYFPNFKIEYKNKSLLMKLISYLLFFNKEFMTSYTTTIGNTIYFPKEDFTKYKDYSSTVIILHELTHMYDAKRIYSKILFSFLYLLPLSLLPLSFLIYLLSIKVGIIFSILCLLPLPAYFRMYFEKRAYMVSLYCLNKLGQKMNFNPMLEANAGFFIDQFTGPSYYFMWIFPNIKSEFKLAIEKIKNGEKPFDDEKLFNMIDNLLEKIITQ